MNLLITLCHLQKEIYVCHAMKNNEMKSSVINIIKYNKGKLGMNLNRLFEDDRGLPTQGILKDKYGDWVERKKKNGKVFYTFTILKKSPIKKTKNPFRNLRLL